MSSDIAIEIQSLSSFVKLYDLHSPLYVLAEYHHLNLTLSFHKYYENSLFRYWYNVAFQGRFHSYRKEFVSLEDRRIKTEESLFAQDALGLVRELYPNMGIVQQSDDMGLGKD